MRRSLWGAIAGAGLGVAAQIPLVAYAQTCDSDAGPANLDFVLEDMYGEAIDLRQYEGKVILLDFWATWCAPCRIEIPGFIELYDTYGPEGFVVLGISVDDPVESIRTFAAELEMDYPVLVGLDRDDVKDAYGPPVGYPTAFIIDRDGMICTSHTGFAPKETFEQDIVELL
jgi:peroxiredoxin